MEKKRSRGLRCYFARVITMLVAMVFSSVSIEAARIKVSCDQPQLVASRQLWVVRSEVPRPAAIQPINLFPAQTLLKEKYVFSEKGVCELELPEGNYRFQVLWQKDDLIVALSSGDRGIKEDATIDLRAQPPATPRVQYLGEEMPVTQLQVRVRGIPFPAEANRGFWEHQDKRTMIREVWSSGKATEGNRPQLILSPGESYPIRIIARKNESHAVLWQDLRSDQLTLDLEKLELREIRFKWGGDEASLERIVDPQWILNLPDLDDYAVPLRKETRLLTNRHWLESSYGYHTKAGEMIHFARRTRLYPKGVNEQVWGGDLKAGAYARIVMQWAKPHQVVIWGAYLFNAQSDVVSTFDPMGNPPTFDVPISNIKWHAALVRADNKELPTGLDNPKRPGSNPLPDDYIKDSIGDIDAMDQVFAIAASYQLDGQTFSLKLKPARFVTWRSKHVSIEGPREWVGQAHSYLGKVERIMDYCAQKELVSGPEYLQIFWTNNWGAGWTNTTRPAEHKRMQMGFEDFRRRQSIFDLPDILVHEMTHAYGYEHGRQQDQVIRFIETVYLYHRHALADRPDYEPLPVNMSFEVESSKNRGDDTFGKFEKIKSD